MGLGHIKIGTALLIPAGVVLVLAQLAAGRARRDQVQDLYGGYPFGAQARMGGHLLGVAGPAAIAACVAVAAVAWLDIHGALGAPRLTVLMGAVLLVALGGALGVAPNPYGPAAAGRARQVARLERAAQPFYTTVGTNTGLLPHSGDSPVYAGLNWGQGSLLGASQFDLATLAAYWSVGLPTVMLQQPPVAKIPGGATPCLADGQARAVVALWLAAASTPAARTHFDAVLAHPAAQISVLSPYQFYDFTQYLGYPVRAAVQLAGEMLRLPASRVQAVLAGRWAYWRDWHTSAGDLASALGIALPAGPLAQDAPPAAAIVEDRPVCR